MNEVLIAELEQWINDLQSGMYVNCVYCGHRYGPADKVPHTMSDALRQHIAQCEKHPMSQLLKCAKATDHCISSLLAVREGVTDDALLSLQQKVRAAILAAEGALPAS